MPTKRKLLRRNHQKAKPAAKPRAEKGSPEIRQNPAVESASTTSGAENGKEAQAADLEKSLAVLAKLKDLEFHSRANIETLARLSLTIEEELKQREFAETIGAIYSTEEAFHSRIAAFIETYQSKCEGMQKPA